MNSNIVLIFGIILVIILGYLYFGIEKYRNKGEKYIRTFPFFIYNNVIKNKYKYKANTPLTAMKVPLKLYKTGDKLPEIFIYNPKYMSPVRDQKDCGACWAFVITSFLSDDVTIRIIKFGKNLSVQELLTCYPKADGCQGANPEDVLNWLEESGFKISINDEYSPVVEEECQKMSENGIAVKKGSVVSLSKYIEKESSQDPSILPIIKENIYNMKMYISQNGPIYSTISVYEDFLNFPGDVPYKKTNNNVVGGHAIEILGWCDPNVDKREGFNEGYWVCKNSWGRNWASEYDFPGYFAIRMGWNECGVESRTGAASPNVNYILRDKLTLGNLAFTNYKTFIRNVEIEKRFRY